MHWLAFISNVWSEQLTGHFTFIKNQCQVLLLHICLLLILMTDRLLFSWPINIESAHSRFSVCFSFNIIQIVLQSFQYFRNWWFSFCFTCAQKSFYFHLMFFSEAVTGNNKYTKRHRIGIDVNQMKWFAFIQYKILIISLMSHVCVHTCEQQKKKKTKTK